jgi:hypothetical protein
MNDNYFSHLAAINVNDHVERKGVFSYLSWPWAVAQLRQFDPTATWEVKRFGDLPYLTTDLGVFVEVAVTVQGTTLSQIHPVLDGKNRPMMAPTSFDINTSLQRCLVKAIALHGLGLYIYAGEDLPEAVEADEAKAATSVQPAKVTPLPTPEQRDAVAPPKRSDTISAAQIGYINKLIKDTGTELKKVLDYFGIERIEDIAKSEASRVIRSLEQSRNRRDAA